MAERADADVIEAELAAYYDAEAADRASRALDPSRVAARSRFLERLGASEALAGPVLEVGVGPGRDAGALVAAGLDLVGVDLSIEHAKRAAAAGAAALVATGRALPFVDAAFRALWSMSTLMHIPDSAIAGVLTEVRRVLAPGAIAAIGVWGGPNVEERSDQDRFDPPRFFSRRTDDRWRTMLGVVGEVQRFERWGEDRDDFWYQFAFVVRDARGG